MTPETNKVEEIAPGVFAVVLWCPESYILHDLLDPSLPFVLCWDHYIGNYSWKKFNLPVINEREPLEVISRGAKFDFIVPTERFLEILPRLGPAIKAVQLSSLPPDHLDMRRIRGVPLYTILGECGWHILLETPANDFGQILSPKRDVLERAIHIDQRVDG